MDKPIIVVSSPSPQGIKYKGINLESITGFEYLPIRQPEPMLTLVFGANEEYRIFGDQAKEVFEILKHNCRFLRIPPADPI